MAKQATPIIDPHLHFFALDLGQYEWLKPQNPPFWPDKMHINCSVNEENLTLDSEFELLGFVHIEAGFDNERPWREIDFLNVSCKLPFSSIAYADLTSDTFMQTVEQLSARQNVVGIRHILDEDAQSILRSTNTKTSFSLLNQLSWNFDAQLSLNDQAAISALCDLANNNPQVRFVINHAGWPSLNKQNNTIQNTWLKSLLQLSQLKNIAIKLSGWEMLDRDWRLADIKNIVHLAIETMGIKRVMLASNFPLCTFSKTYAELWSGYHNNLGLNPEEFHYLAHHNALHWYQLKIITQT